jgi:hypothetical protein
MNKPQSQPHSGTFVSAMDESKCQHWILMRTSQIAAQQKHEEGHCKRCVHKNEVLHETPQMDTTSHSKNKHLNNTKEHNITKQY